MSNAHPSQPRKHPAIVDYAAFTLLFASVSVAVAMALGGIVLLLTPSTDATDATRSPVPVENAAHEATQDTKGGLR